MKSRIAQVAPAFFLVLQLGCSWFCDVSITVAGPLDEHDLTVEFHRERGYVDLTFVVLWQKVAGANQGAAARSGWGIWSRGIQEPPLRVKYGVVPEGMGSEMAAAPLKEGDVVMVSAFGQQPMMWGCHSCPFVIIYCEIQQGKFVRITKFDAFERIGGR